MFWFIRREHISEADLSAHVDGQLPPRQAERVGGHLSRCAACREAHDGLRATKSLLADLPRERPVRSYVLSPEVAGLATPRRQVMRRPVLTYAPAVALTLLVALLAVDFVVLPGDESERGPVESLAAAERATGEEQAGGANFAAPSAADGASDASARSAAARDSQAEPAPSQSGVTKDDDQAGALAPEGTSLLPEENGDSSDRTVLRSFEAAAAIVLGVSILAVIKARSGRRRVAT